MKIFYITFNTETEAKNVSLSLLENRLAVCTNWFPINCAYRWQGKIEINSECVLIVKTKENYRKEIEKIISEHISYTNFIAEIDVHSINHGFTDWLNAEMPEFSK